MKAPLPSARGLAIACGALLVTTAGFAGPVPPNIPHPEAYKTPGEFADALRRQVDRQAEELRKKSNPDGGVREAPKHGDLEQAYKDALRNNPMKRLPADPDNKRDPAKIAPPADLIASSDILCHRGKATLVPKRAILVAPDSFASRLKLDKGAQILNWADFFKANRDWIRTVEVSRPQAEGVEPLPETTSEMVKNAKTLIVATFQGGPISVLPLKVAAATETPTPDTP